MQFPLLSSVHMHWFFLEKVKQNFQTATAAYQRADLATDRR